MTSDSSVPRSKRRGAAAVRRRNERECGDPGCARRHDSACKRTRAQNRGGGAMELTVATILVAFAGVFLICFMKGAFGGGFSIVGIPLLSTVMDPVTAGG